VSDSNRKAIIKNYDRCPVYNFCEIHNINLASSSAKVQDRLSAIGINPKNAPVDATNYICYDVGQPLHCFDADDIHGDIIIRNASEGENFTDLFGKDHILTADDLVITDSDGILALAGVVGGARGMTKDTTKNIILESAYFSPIGIQKTRRRLGISTDASYRYERGIDPTITGDAIDMASKLVIDACGGDIVGGNFEPGDYAENIIRYDPKLFLKKTGLDLPVDEQRRILERLGCAIEDADGVWIVTAPPARVNLEIPESLIAEIIRLYGYDKINGAPHENNTPVQNGNYDAEQKIICIKKRLCELGLTESIT
jgi:phenylalanyl-tRNA synthetase beta chain